MSEFNPIARKFLYLSSDIKCSEVYVDYESFNTRAAFDATSVADLAADIQRNGQLQNVVMDQVADAGLQSLGYKFQCRAGFRRFKAISEILKHETIKSAIYAPLTPDEALALNYIENDQRRPLSFHEEAGVVKRFMNQGTTSMVQIGIYMNKTHEWVRLRLLYLSLPAEVQEAVQRNEITQVDLRKVGAEYKRDPERALNYFKSVRRSNKATLTRSTKDDTSVKSPADGKMGRAPRIKQNAAIRSLYAMVNRLFPEGDLTVATLRWILGEATDEDVKAAAFANFTGDVDEFNSIFLIGQGEFQAPAVTECDHMDAIAVQELDGTWRGRCLSCGKVAGETAPDVESAKVLLSI